MSDYVTRDRQGNVLKEGTNAVLCDGKCNSCPLINHPNSRMLTALFNVLDEFGRNAYEIVQNHCPNLTVCYDCRIDDFGHVEGCELI